MPAVVDAAALALAEYGTKSLADVMAPAIALADGFPMYEFLSHYLETERAACEPYAATMATYYPGGRVTPAGEMFRQPNLAKTLRAIVAAEKAALEAGKSRVDAIRAGRDAFYNGDIARRIAAANREAGGVMTEDDLSSYRGRIEAPQTTRYRGYDVYKAGPWNQSPVLLQTLNLLEGFDLAAMGPQSADAIHVIAESIKLAYADRDRYYGDPDFVDVPVRGLLSKPYADARRALIDLAARQHGASPGRSAPVRACSIVFVGASPDARRRRRSPCGRWIRRRRRPNPATPPSIQVVDAQGNLFSATPSSGWLLGGAFVAGDTGVPMGNRMQAFRLDPQSPNVLQGGKRPRTTLTPTVVMKDGGPVPRDRDARRRQPGSADPARAAQRDRPPHGPAGRHRGAARQLAAPRVVVRRPPCAARRARGRVVTRARRARGAARTRPRPARASGLWHLNRHRRRGPRSRGPPAPRRCRSPTRTLRRRLVSRYMQIVYEKRTLANGLDVIVHEDRDLPIVAVNVWYHVGSKNERPGRTGFAHLFEHLMFEGSAHHDHGYFPPLQEAGASLNGSTNADRTNYWEVVPIRRARPARCGWNPTAWATCCRR